MVFVACLGYNIDDAQHNRAANVERFRTILSMMLYRISMGLLVM
jgi:hypothetical protein